MGAGDGRSLPPGHRRRRRTTPSTPAPEDRGPCAPANQPLSATLGASKCLQAGTRNSPKGSPGSATWPRSAMHPTPRWTSIQNGWCLAKIQSGASSAMPLLTLGRLALMRSCSRPDRRSSPQRGSYSSPPSTTANQTAKPQTDQTDAMQRNHQRAMRKRRNRHTTSPPLQPFVTICNHRASRSWLKQLQNDSARPIVASMRRLAARRSLDYFATATRPTWRAK